MSDYNTYLSPYSWRYASGEMRSLWSERDKRLLWRRIWCALARVQSGFGLVKPEQVAELEAKAGEIDIARSIAIEEELKHDLMAEVRAFAEKCPTAGGVIHLGATSMDIEDNADALRMRAALDIVIKKLADLLGAFAAKIDEHADTPVMAFTHLQPAEPTTLGYRFAMWAQDLLADYRALVRVRADLKGKGFKGAVGTAASYAELLGMDKVDAFERAMSKALDLPFFPIATQTYPRRQDYDVVSALAGLGASLHKFAFDLRVLQSPPVGELSEPFGAKQVGSSAMPFKRNPINAEKIDSLSRALSVLPQVAWQNAAQSLLERTLDDSANRRSMLPEAFLACDELLIVAKKLVTGVQVSLESIQRTMDAYGPFASTERVMMAAAKKGADRQECHERLRELALAAWAEVRLGKPNPLAANVAKDTFFGRYLDSSTIASLMKEGHYAGTAPARARDLAREIRSAVG